MQSRFYRPDEHRAEKVNELFATIARRYDLLNDIMSAGLHRRWKRRLVEMAETDPKSASNPSSKPARQVLDLCCGTGDIALRFAQNGARVTGVDFTTEMLQVAMTRSTAGRPPPPPTAEVAQPSRLPSLNWLQGDALRLPFPDNLFDVVSVGYGLRNLADIERGLREAWRVLRPGGKFLSLDFGKPESSMLRSLYFGYLRTILPILGRLYCGDPDTHGYILASLQEYPAQRGMKTLMERCGYGDCGFEEFCGGTMAINFGSKAG
ncbi:MAG TPA: ubiquinone/menaquinone biosynthesis methyltransferase [Verrucomicrobiae bacterium]|nr:ubiquinone/menaquinone biosynthesis methyltransferase [Verrucomicrobiae bacterium]